MTSTKIMIDMAVAQANSMQPDLVQQQRTTIARATNGSMYASALPSGAFKDQVKEQVIDAGIFACTQVSLCNNVYSATIEAVAQATDPVCGQGLFGSVLNLATSSVLDTFTIFGSTFA